MPLLHITGVDPGLVHTGCVRIQFDKQNRRIYTAAAVVKGIDADAVAAWISSVEPSPWIFIERYVPRSNFGTDERMVQGERDLRGRLPDAQMVRNTGVKTIVTPQVLGVLGLTRFALATHHQDLLSAARIAVLGMMKTDLNRDLADVVMDHIDGNPWTVEDLGSSYVS